MFIKKLCLFLIMGNIFIAAFEPNLHSLLGWATSFLGWNLVLHYENKLDISPT